MKYILTKYETDLSLSGYEMNCTLYFEKYFYKWKIGVRVMRFQLSYYVTWRKCFELWDKMIADRKVFSKKELKSI